MSRLVALLLADFNVYRYQTRFYAQRMDEWAIRPARMQPATAELLGSMVGWCRERAIEPRLWLYGLFRFRGWKWPVRLDRGSLMSERQIPRYRRLSGLGFFQRRVMATSLEGVGGEWDQNRDLAPHVEQLKSRYAAEGRHATCLDEQIVRTLGYHPASRVCRQCPVAGECAARLEGLAPFSFLALRAGRMTASQAAECGRAGTT